MHIFQKFKNFWKLAHFGVFNILKPQNDIPIVSYDLKDENNALKRKLKKYFSKGIGYWVFSEIYHTVNRLRSFLSLDHWSLGHSVTLSLCHFGHSVTRSLGHLVTESLGHSVTQSVSHLVSWSLGHLVTQSLGHSVTQSLSHSVLRSLFST